MKVPKGGGAKSLEGGEGLEKRERVLEKEELRQEEKKKVVWS